MKIIGKADYGFIVMVAEEELAKIAGFAYSSLMKHEDRPQVGKEIKVSELYAALQVSRERKDEISELAEALRRVAGRVDSINQALAAPIIEVKVTKEDH